MPRPRLSDCERQVPTKDRASVHCFWCGQRGHFWYDKFTSKRCTNQPKLTAAVGVGGGVQQRQESGAENKSREQGPEGAKRSKSAQRTHIRVLWHNNNSHHALSR